MFSPFLLVFTLSMPLIFINTLSLLYFGMGAHLMWLMITPLIFNFSPDYPVFVISMLLFLQAFHYYAFTYLSQDKWVSQGWVSKYSTNHTYSYSGSIWLCVLLYVLGLKYLIP